MTKDEKLKEITELTAKQVALLEKSAQIAAKPQPKRAVTSLKRAIKIMGFALEARRLETQKQIIAHQPLPKPNFEKRGLTVNDRSKK